MKKLCGVLLFVAMMMAQLPAFAAPGDTVFQFGNIWSSTKVHSSIWTVMGDTVYHFERISGEAFAYTLGEEAIRPLTWSASAVGEDILACFEWEGSLFCIAQGDGRVYELSMEGDRIASAEVMRLEWGSMLDLLSGSEYRAVETNSPFVEQGRLYLAATAEFSSVTELACFDLADGSQKRLGSYSGLRSIAQYKDGMALAIMEDKEL